MRWIDGINWLVCWMEMEGMEVKQTNWSWWVKRDSERYNPLSLNDRIHSSTQHSLHSLLSQFVSFAAFNGAEGTNWWSKVIITVARLKLTAGMI